MIPDILGMTQQQLVSLNPWIGSSCDTGIWSQLTNDGYEQLCVQAKTGFPTTTIEPSSTSTSTATATTSTLAAPTQPGASKDCVKWHKVASGDGCWSIANDAGITLDTFYALNPGVGTDCSTLWLGYLVCIG